MRAMVRGVGGVLSLVLLLSSPVLAAFSAPVNLLSQNNKVAGTSFTAALEAALAVNDIAVVVVAKDNVVLSGVQDVLSISDPGGNTWTLLRRFRMDGGTLDNQGASVLIWFSKITTALANGALLTITLSDSRTAKAVIGIKTTVAAGKTIAVATGGAGDLADAGVDAGAITLSGLASKEYLFIRGGAIENALTTYTASTSYTAAGFAGANTSGGGAATNMAARLESRILTGTGDTTNPTTSASDQASIMLALEEVAAPLGTAPSDEDDFQDESVMPWIMQRR